jgi:hypothetical protein
MYEPCMQPDIGTFSPKRSHRSFAPLIHAKNVYYRSDGTGRDQYIVYV